MRRPRGFTFVEVMVAAAIFMVGFSAITAADLTVSRQLARALHKERAMVIATSLTDMGQCVALDALQAQVAAYPVTSYDQDGLATGRPGGSQLGAFYAATASLTQQPSGSGSNYAYKVVVSWSEPYLAADETVSIETLLPAD